MEMRLRLPAIALAVALWLIMTGAAAHQPVQRSAAELMDVVMWNRETIGGPFALIDHHGKQKTDADFRGKLLIVYFGFTGCSDVCPTDLQQIALAINSLGRSGDDVQPLFITLDPARDQPKRLAAYVPSFHSRLIGLSGTPAAIAHVASAYRVYYKNIRTGNAGDYTVDHSAFIYLMDRKGKYLGFFPPGTAADRMTQVIRPYLN